MMKNITPIFIAAALFAAGCSNNPTLEDRTDTLSWALGRNTALSLISGNEAVKIDNEVYMQALRHTLDGREQPITDQEYAEAMQYIIATTRMHQMKSAKEQQNSVDKAQNEYFEKLAKENPNVKRHPSGFYYEVLRKGHGPNAKYAQRIRFDYRSFLMLTGEPYDQTYEKREPIIHVVGKPMFHGLIDAFQLMNAGSIYRFYFPYQLAFGEQGAGEIPGYTPFIYEIELHDIYKD
jgi:FKBP-type peptidyl-prolyl cis-trans isomerase